ncbi:MAG: BTAD domain-containing putative transcriptional regulator [Deltaproteobacteria bacterium]|nr:BTAD domain-containing putative transcriptional regulator [Deltaproteobacteria bacterium]
MRPPRIAKVTRPTPKGIFPRKRLFRLLDRMRERPVIWVSGPPGCGKTTLISSYLDARDLPWLWYQLDEGDSDLATFFYYLGLAAQKTSQPKHPPLPLLTPEYLAGIPTFTLRYFENLYQRQKVPSVMIFDNYQEVPADSSFHGAILQALSRIPDRLNVILISRGDPPPSFARLHANQQMEILGWNDLRLTLEECRGFIRLSAKEVPAPEMIRHLHGTADGWAAGLVLMLERAKVEGLALKEIGKLTPEEIFHYFGSEIFDRADEEVQEFLLKSALFPRMTAKMAEALTGLPSAARILATLSRDHYFTERRFHTEPLYEYHPLFREFLLSRAQEKPPGQGLSALYSRAAQIMENAGQPEEAVKLLQGAGLWEEMVPFILKYAPGLLNHGRNRPLEEWLVALPQEVLENHPCQVAGSMFIALLLRQPGHPAMKTWTEKVLKSIDYLPSTSDKMQISFRLVFYRLHVGDFPGASVALDLLRQLSRSPEASSIAQLSGKLGEAMYHRYTGRHEECLKAVSAGLEFSRTTGVHMLDHVLIYHGTASAMDGNDFQEAERFLVRMAASSENFKPWDKSFYHLLMTREALHRADLGQASLQVELALKFSKGVGYLHNIASCHLLMALVLHEQKKDREAADHLACALRIFRGFKSQNFEFCVLLAEAFFALDRGEEAQGLLSVRKAFALGREGGYLPTFIDFPDAMARLCTRALEEGIEVAYVQDLIRKGNLTPEKDTIPPENWPWPLKVFTLGRFEILRDGRPIQFPRKIQQKPLAMLKVLIALGGREVRDDQVADLLWPESEGDTAHMSFISTLHRLRQLLGHEKAVQYRDGRVALDGRFCWVDVRAFERMAEEAQARWKKGMTDQAIQLSEKALEMYGGAFLPGDMDQPWSLSLRERLKGKLLGTVNRLADERCRLGQWEKAAEYYQKGLEINDLIEEFYQNLMDCYLHLGKKAEALAVFQRCTRTLSAALGIEPSAKTRAMYNFLLAGDQKIGKRAAGPNK